MILLWKISAAEFPLLPIDEMQSLLFNEIVAYEKKLDFSTAQEKAVSYVGMYPEDEEAAKELDFLKSRTGSNE